VLATLAGLLAGVICGLLNGFLTAYWWIQSFIITLGMLNIARGAALQVSDAQTVYAFPKAFENFGSALIFGMPLVFLLALALVGIAWFTLNRTVLGRLIYSIGNNEKAVRLAGHSVFRYKMIAFTLCGLMVRIAAIVYVARLNIASPITGIGFELNAIAAVTIGGTSDQQAIGALRAARDLRIDVPGDLAIVGFDDITLADLVVPRLTTGRQPVTEMAEEAV
jgi:ribose transport system permease protein